MAFMIDALDSDKKKDGVWVDYEGASFRIASSSNPRYVNALVSNQRPFKRQIDKGTIKPEDSLFIVCKSIAQGILVDWKNVGTTDGKDVPYSVEAAIEALVNIPSFREFVLEFAQSEDEYARDELKETVKK